MSLPGRGGRQTILVTGFGPFPGAPNNPTTAIVERLDGMRSGFEQSDIRLATEVLPVVYTEVDRGLRRLIKDLRPDAILHLGLASKRRSISVETRARNDVSCVHPDAAGGLPASPLLTNAGPRTLPATYDAAGIVTAIRHLGHPVRLSRSAGDYVCNALLYRSLECRAAPQVGFIHVPKPAESKRGSSRRRLSIEDLTDAVETAIRVMMQRPATARQPSAPKARSRDAAPKGP